MSSVDNCLIGPIRKMQGHYKHVDGLSDSSSIGSFMDETDREVSNLTDRAFRSLCAAEEAVFNDSESTITPPRPALNYSNNFQNKDTLKRAPSATNTTCNKVLEEQEKLALTFQQLKSLDPAPEEKCAQNNQMAGVSNGYSGSGHRSNKNASKVSSLIKAFDQGEEKLEGVSKHIRKQAAQERAPSCKAQPEKHLAQWDTSALLSNHRELPSLPAAYLQGYKLSDCSDMQSKTEKVNNFSQDDHDSHSEVAAILHRSASDLHSSSKKPQKNKTDKLSKGKKLASNNNFLHSEHSAFKSWRDHSQQIVQKEDTTKLVPTIEIPNLYTDAPASKEVIAVVNGPLSTREKMTKQQVNDSPSNAVSVPSKLQPASTLEKSSNAQPKNELGNVCPPWRRSRSSMRTRQATPEGISETMKTKVEKKAPASQTVLSPTENKLLDSDTPRHETPSFSISKLLTPVIGAKHDLEPFENQVDMISPPIIDIPTINEPDGRGITEYRSRDSYKSRASSLLFNLKDVRKRVKSTYSPSPTFKSLEGKGKESSRQDTNIKTSMTTPEQHIVDSNVFSTKEKTSKSLDITSPVLSVPSLNTQVADVKNDHDACLTDNYLSLSSPQTVKGSLRCQSEENSPQENIKEKLSTSGAGSSVKAAVLGHHQLSESSVKKRPDYPLLKLYKKEELANEMMVEPCFRRKQEHEWLHDAQMSNCRIEKGFEKQNAKGIRDSLMKSLPKQDSNFSQNQSPLAPSTGSKARSLSSSRISYLSLDHNQCEREEESRRRSNPRHRTVINGRKVATEQNVTEKSREIGKEELQYYALSSCSSNLEKKEWGKSQFKESPRMSEGERLKEWSIKKMDLGSSVESLVEEGLNNKIPKSEMAQATPSPSMRLNMFKIKDNTFKSSPVIKTVKLPLLKNWSEGVLSDGQREAALKLEEDLKDEKSLIKEYEVLLDVRGDQSPSVESTRAPSTVNPSAETIVPQGKVESTEARETSVDIPDSAVAPTVAETVVSPTLTNVSWEDKLSSTSTAPTLDDKVFPVFTSPVSEETECFRPEGESFISALTSSAMEDTSFRIKSISPESNLVDTLRSAVEVLESMACPNSITRISEGITNLRAEIPESDNLSPTGTNSMSESIIDSIGKATDSDYMRSPTGTTVVLEDTVNSVEKTPESEYLISPATISTVSENNTDEVEKGIELEYNVSPAEAHTVSENVINSVVNTPETEFTLTTDVNISSPIVSKDNIDSPVKIPGSDQIEINITPEENVSPLVIHTRLEDIVGSLERSTTPDYIIRANAIAETNTESPLRSMSENTIDSTERMMEARYVVNSPNRNMMFQENRGSPVTHTVSEEVLKSIAWTTEPEYVASSAGKNTVSQETACSEAASIASDDITYPIRNIVEFDPIVSSDERNTVSKENAGSPMKTRVAEDIIDSIGKISESDYIVNAAGNKTSRVKVSSPAAGTVSEDITELGRNTESDNIVSSPGMSLENVKTKVKNRVMRDKEGPIVRSRRSENVRRSTAKSEPVESSKVVSERSDLIGGITDKAMGKPPVVPPKTEKALRRAKKLANRRKKTDAKPQKEDCDIIAKKPVQAVSSMPSSPVHASLSPLPLVCSPVPSVHLDSALVPPVPSIVTINGTQSVTPISSFPLTQRKLLQDPESGQYFVVDIPIQVKTKTFYDPQTGKYIQVSIPSSDSNLSRATSLEVLNAPYVLYPGFLSLPLTTVRSSSQMSAPAAFTEEKGKFDPSESWSQDVVNSSCGSDTHPYIEPVCDSHSQHTDKSQCGEEKDISEPRSLDIISISELEDFAVESLY
ncbi:cardiac-enriched FHL2-interacting protein [Latimeria chalumnae]|uniref:cardiac-enriched FHL2-interacting protein n=1 Tax=Latimeria chalumnae TaxID=7897 RepID=UPI0003C158AB|nr:PREDICTED: uncharacterized protein C10orf71 homolog [Latimeria chalumnae]XP_006004302.1 PREDICTED: uncharacterized protein C10orf71 homolog [Latimeria chalumnae]XP_006004303.1 PREDICTED: uncharacterized protein C10orf71 homolog [Latimeria chalumnae]XP_006004304.1 PREDICTED: uncharacterized protein C10orf71 homolog [Latimeria chalumnae]XP_006004305.1 PREDICTED: uncharacterized protein C10orf71 homolog [Latimeria chalumnae]|eukprot:XP_006004301.1 PREDICTED: uncharacterized protein C10orf71 homolog [Latimeria chalumnae]